MKNCCFKKNIKKSIYRLFSNFAFELSTSSSPVKPFGIFWWTAPPENKHKNILLMKNILSCFF